MEPETNYVWIVNTPLNNSFSRLTSQDGSQYSQCRI